MNGLTSSDYPLCNLILRDTGTSRTKECEPTNDSGESLFLGFDWLNSARPWSKDMPGSTVRNRTEVEVNSSRDVGPQTTWARITSSQKSTMHQQLANALGTLDARDDLPFTYI